MQKWLVFRKRGLPCGSWSRSAPWRKWTWTETWWMKRSQGCKGLGELSSPALRHEWAWYNQRRHTRPVWPDMCLSRNTVWDSERKRMGHSIQGHVAKRKGFRLHSKYTGNQQACWVVTVSKGATRWNYRFKKSPWVPHSKEQESELHYGFSFAVLLCISIFNKTASSGIFVCKDATLLENLEKCFHLKGAHQLWVVGQSKPLW